MRGLELDGALGAPLEREQGPHPRLAWLVVALAGLLRLGWLDLRPLHHDEGTNAIFILRLLQTGHYEYDPGNYHGPLLYYLSAAALTLFGQETVALRLVPALLGTLLVALVFLLRRDIGPWGSWGAALLLAVSPSMVYYSRDDIHEIYLAILTLLLVVAMRRLTSGSAGWAVLAGVGAGGMLATKETAVLILAALALAAVATRWGGRGWPRPGSLLLAGGVALLLAAALYTALFREPGELLAPIRSIVLWTHRGLAQGGHVKPWWYFPVLLAREETVVLLLAAAGAVLAARRRDGFALFLAVWPATLLGIHSAIPYKTPWLVLNLVLPMGLLAGVSVEALARRSGRVGRMAPALVAIACLVPLGRAIDLSFLRYDVDGASQLIYVQTERDALRLVKRIERYAQRVPEGRRVGIQILSPDYLPLNWYLRDFPNVGYYGEPIEHPPGPIVLARLDAAERVAADLGSGWTREDYHLRPGVRLALFLRRADAGHL
jgi:uncharacterized protein (TIGR03663 family)